MGLIRALSLVARKGVWRRHAWEILTQPKSRGKNFRTRDEVLVELHSSVWCQNGATDMETTGIFWSMDVIRVVEIMGVITLLTIRRKRLGTEWEPLGNQSSNRLNPVQAGTSCLRFILFLQLPSNLQVWLAVGRNYASASFILVSSKFLVLLIPILLSMMCCGMLFLASIESIPLHVDQDSMKPFQREQGRGEQTPTLWWEEKCSSVPTCNITLEKGVKSRDAWSHGL